MKNKYCVLFTILLCIAFATQAQTSKQVHQMAYAGSLQMQEINVSEQLTKP